MSKVTKKRQECRSTLETRPSDFSKGSTPLQLSPVCYTLQEYGGQIEEKISGYWLTYHSSLQFSDTAVCWNVYHFEWNSSEMPISAFLILPLCQTWSIFVQTDQLSSLSFRDYLCKWHGYHSAKFCVNVSNRNWIIEHQMKSCVGCTAKYT